MKLLVFSDSHGRTAEMDEAVRAHLGSADAVLFLGDGLRDYMTLKELYSGRIGFFAVSGNCDGAVYRETADAPLVRRISFEGFNFLMTHGHIQHAKHTADGLISLGASEGSDVVVYGHTHTPDNTYISEPPGGQKPLRLFNPGSISSYPYSYGIIEIRGKSILLTNANTEEKL